MKKQILTILLSLAVIIVSNLTVISPVNALTQLKVSDISYHECTGELAENLVTSDGSGDAANCFIITGQVNNTSGKPVVDADVFGRIYDANGNPTLQNRTRLGTIEEVPVGVSDFEIRISVSANQPTPLKLEQFKAAGFSSRVRPFYYDDYEN
jgi:hypothetical protein